MPNLLSGERITLEKDELQITLKGRNPEDIAIAMFIGNGTVKPLERINDREWRLTNSKDHPKYDIVAYIKDDRQGGFVNEKMPFTLTINDKSYTLEYPSQQLAAVIIAEHYIKDGKSRLKICNEGYAFGIKAYARSHGYNETDIPLLTRGPKPESHPAPLPWREPDMPRGQNKIGNGSGVRIAPGLIITNAHVIEHGTSFTTGGNQERLEPLAVDTFHDLALLQCRSEGNYLPMRTGDPVWLGENVITAGYPLVDILGADLKLTTGNVSGLTGGLGDVSRFQFTAPIASGSSGGAIVDEAGNLVGITSAALAHHEMRNMGGTSENVNFGVKVGLVLEMIAAAGMTIPRAEIFTKDERRNISNRLRQAVIPIQVMR